MKRNVLRAVKAMKDAEELMRSKDYDGARESLLKAHNFYPKSEKISSKLAACDALLGKEPTFGKEEAKKKPSQDFYNFEDDRKLEHLKLPGEIWASYSEPGSSNHSYRYARVSFHSKAALFVQWLKPAPVTPAEKKWCDADLPVACGPFELDPEMKQDIRWPQVSFYKCSSTRGATKERYNVYPQKGEVWAVYEVWDLDAVKGHGLVLVEIISDFAKFNGVDVALLVKVNAFRSIYQRRGGKAETLRISPTDLYRFSHCIPSYRFKGGEIKKVSPGMLELDLLALPDAPTQADDSSNKAPEIIELDQLPMMPALPPKQLDKHQLWTAYTGKDNVPRAYVRLDDRISDAVIRVSLLEPLPELGHEVKWKNRNLPISCGVFKVSGTRMHLQVSSLCCQVFLDGSNCGKFYRTFPLKGEVWAMFKNWNANWEQEDFETHQCQIVEVVSSYSEANAVRIAKLGRAIGCASFFQRLQHEGFDLVQTVCREDLLSFSHRIPAFRVPGIGQHGVPENSWHLEMDALPLKPGISL